MSEKGKKNKEEKEEKKENITKDDRTKHVILITILIVVLMGVSCAMGYALGGTSIIKEVTGDKKETKTHKATKPEEKGKSLDVNSRIVRFLYDEVTADQEEPSCTALWQFGDMPVNFLESSFDAEKASEQIKMQIVGLSISSLHKNYVNLSEVPQRTDAGVGEKYDATSGYYYTKIQVESLYKRIFGQDAKLDTTVPIYYGPYQGIVYHYDDASQRYYVYYRNTGGSCGGHGLKLSLEKATQDGNTIKIYQYTEYVEGSLTTPVNYEVKEKYYLVYSFEQESDGLYRFIGITKETI